MKPWNIASELCDIDGVDGVRASERRITVAYAPEDRHVEEIPDSVYDAVHDALEGTLWQSEYKESRASERHSWSGGRSHDPVCAAGDMPAGYELQYHLVQ